MVGKVFNLAKVVPGMFTASLSQTVSTWDSLAHIESITDATNDIEHTENNKQC